MLTLTPATKVLTPQEKWVRDNPDIFLRLSDHGFDNLNSYFLCESVTQSACGIGGDGKLYVSYEWDDAEVVRGTPTRAIYHESMQYNVDNDILVFNSSIKVDVIKLLDFEYETYIYLYRDNDAVWIVGNPQYSIPVVTAITHHAQPDVDIDQTQRRHGVLQRIYGKSPVDRMTITNTLTLDLSSAEASEWKSWVALDYTDPIALTRHIKPDYHNRSFLRHMSSVDVRGVDQAISSILATRAN